MIFYRPPPAPSGGCTTTTFDKDGATIGNSTTGASLTTPGFSTSNCNNLVVVGVATNSSVSSVTDAQGRLTFTRRSAASGGGNDVEVWTAPLSGTPLSGDAITVNLASSSFVSAYVNSFSGYKTAAPFDPNGAIPNTTTTSSSHCSWTTSNANDIIYGFAIATATSPDAGFTLLSDANAATWFIFGEYQVVSATQAGTTPTNIVNQTVCDAVQEGP